MKKKVILMIYPSLSAAAAVDIFLKNDEIELVGVVISNRFYKNSNDLRDMYRIFKVSGLSFLNYCILCTDIPWIFMGLQSKFNRVIKDIPVLKTKDINSDDSKAWLKARDADYIASCYFNQVIDMEVAKLAKIDCVNVHTAMLPNDRGPLPIFWAMFQGFEKVGISIHKVEEDVDMGEVYLQKKISMPDRSLVWNEFYFWSNGANILAKWIACPEKYEFTRFKQIQDEGSYQGFPSKASVDEFFSRDKLLFKSKDLKEAVMLIKSDNYDYLAN